MTTLASWTSGPDSHTSADGLVGREAVQSTPPIVNCTLVRPGQALGTKVPGSSDDSRTSYCPAVGTLAVTTANRMDPSGQVVLTSVCVVKPDNLRPALAAPAGSATPKVAQPGDSCTLATVAPLTAPA